MRLTTLVAAGLGLSAMTAAPVAAQLRANRPPPQQQNLPRLLVANPYSFAAQDSSASVRVGHGMREQVSGVADRWYRTVTRIQMNEALQQYAYPIDAVLPPLVARTLATTLTARAIIVSTLVRGEAGRFSVEARLTGISDDAGQVVRLSQNPNESFEDFGKRVADAMTPAFRALPDARACESQRGSLVDKAIESAVKALRVLPTSGLAHYCLAQIQIAKKGPPDSIVAHLKLATQGDPVSLPVWTALAIQHQAKGDSNQTVETFKQMLRVAPTNEALRKEAFGLFQRYGRPDAAEEVADEGIKLDSVNADMWDLKFGACIAQGTTEKNRCAIEAIEQVFRLDTTKADTTFYTKATFAASRPSLQVKLTIDSAGTKLTRDTVVVDSVRFLKWARMGADKYPANVYLLSQLAESYSLAGPVDSAVEVTKRLMAADSSDVGPVLRVILKLANAKRLTDAMALAPYIERLGSTDDKGTLASILVQGAFATMTSPDWPTLTEAGRKIIGLAQPGSRNVVYGNYLLGVSLFQHMADLDKKHIDEKTLSCEVGQQLRAMHFEAGPALEAGRSVQEAFVAQRIGVMDQFGKHIDAVIKQYCK